MHGKLNEDREKDIEIEDVAKWPLPRQFLYRLEEEILKSGATVYSIPMQLTLAREMHKKHIDINTPVIVT